MSGRADLVWAAVYARYFFSAWDDDQQQIDAARQVAERQADLAVFYLRSSRRALADVSAMVDEMRPQQVLPPEVQQDREVLVRAAALIVLDIEAQDQAAGDD